MNLIQRIFNARGSKASSSPAPAAEVAAPVVSAAPSVQPENAVVIPVVEPRGASPFQSEPMPPGFEPTQQGLQEEEGYTGRVSEAEAAAIGRKLAKIMLPKPPKIPDIPAPVPPPPKWTDQFPWYRPEHTFLPSREFMTEFCKRCFEAGFLKAPAVFLPEDKAVLRPLAEREDKANEKLEEVGHRAVHDLLSKYWEVHEAVVAKGGTPEEPPNRVLVEADIHGKRIALRGEIRSVRTAAKPIIARVCNRLAEAGKQLAVKMHTEEQAEAAHWGNSFEPSPALRAVVFLADQGFKFQADHAIGPHSIIFGLYSHKDLD